MADVLVKSKEAIVIVLDVGVSMHNGCRHRPTILSKAKACISMILQRKIFSESKDEVALVLFGTFETSNNLATPGSSEYNNIKVVQNLRPASWELLHFVNETEGTDCSSDLIKNNALLLAMDLLRNTVNGKKFFSRRILFLSHIDDLFCGGMVNRICEGLKSAKIDLNLIGPFSLCDDGSQGDFLQQSYNKTPEQTKAEAVVCQLLKEVNGESYSFEEALPALIYYQKKSVQSLPWNANLDIGKNLTIPISAYIKVYESKSKPWKTAFAHKLNAKIERETSYHINDEAQTEVPKDNVIPAYRYGTTLVPFSEEDKVNMEYQSGEKGMKVLGFTKEENVCRYYLIGDKTMYIFGQKNRELAGVILAPFIQALLETKMVAIVRYVYSARSAPKIGFLSPRIKTNYECLIFTALPFMEDLRHFMFAPLDTDSKNLPTDDQLSLVDELIKSMDLSSAAMNKSETRDEALKAMHAVNPFLQRLYQCLQHKAFSPDSPLPDIPPHIRTVIEPSQELSKACEPVIKKIQGTFSLKEGAMKRPYERGGNLFTNGKSMENGGSQKKIKVDDGAVTRAADDTVVEVGTVNPVRDFQHLMKRSDNPEWFRHVCKQLQSAVLRFLSDEMLNLYHEKFLSCLCEYKSSSIKKEEPALFNSFMKSLKGTIISRSPSLWMKIIEGKLGLITSAECFSSTVTFQEAVEFNNYSPEESIVLDRERMDDEQDLLAEL